MTGVPCNLTQSSLAGLARLNQAPSRIRREQDTKGIAAAPASIASPSRAGATRTSLSMREHHCIGSSSSYSTRMSRHSTSAPPTVRSTIRVERTSPACHEPSVECHTSTREPAGYRSSGTSCCADGNGSGGDVAAAVLASLRFALVPEATNAEWEEVNQRIIRPSAEATE